jgi:hypothetical protein
VWQGYSFASLFLSGDLLSPCGRSNLGAEERRNSNMWDYGIIINMLEAEAQRCESIFGAASSFGRGDEIIQ